MEYALDITDPEVLHAIEQLDLRPENILLKNLSSFPGQDKEQKLRYEHHTKRVQKYCKQIKAFLKSEKIASKHRKFLSFDSLRTESQESSVTRIKEKFKMNLSAQIKIESKKRSLLNSSIQKLMRKEKLEEKRKIELQRKREKDEVKKEQVQRRISDLLVSQRTRVKNINDRLSRESSRLSNITPRGRWSRLSESVSRNLNENFSEEKLKNIHQKLDKSKENQREKIRYKTDRIADHNEKVVKKLENQIKFHESLTQNKLLSIMKKNEQLENYKNKKEKILNDLKLKKQLKKSKFEVQVKGNLEEECAKMKDRVRKLETKSVMERKVLMTHISEMSKEKEYKLLKKMLKDEDAKDNLLRIKKESQKKKEELLERYMASYRRFLDMKDSREKLNQKVRFEASLAKQEQMKAKMIHLMINRCDNPTDISKVIEKKF